MISIWDMIVGSGYPGNSRNQVYIGIGMGVFALSFLIAIMTLPLLIYLIGRYYTQLLKLKRGMGGRLERDRNYEYDYYRIIICFLIGACIVTLLIVVMSTHGLYFLYKICIYRNYLRVIEHDFQKERLTYVIPSSHYVLYFLEAAYEAAKENLILWGFLFLVNFICKLTVKKFYFKIFTLVLSIRVVFVFACHFNIWERLLNYMYYHSQEEVRDKIVGIALAMYPFHTIAKALRVLEILCSLIVFIPFALYIRRLIAQILAECNLRDENNVVGENTPLHGHNVVLINAKEKVDIEFAKKYLRGYTVFLIIHLILNLLECHFISLIVYKYTNNGNDALLIVEMVTSVITDILAFLPSFLFLLFITYFVYAAMKGVRQDVRQDGEPEQQRYRWKRYTLTVLIILFCSLFCTGLIGYLRFTDGDSVRIELNNYDYILFNESRKTDLSEFVDSCEEVEFSNSPRNQLTPLDFLTLYYDPMEGNITDINIYGDYDENPTYINENITVDCSDWPDCSIRMWFPANTCLHNINVIGGNSINYTLTPIPYPCYGSTSDGSANDGLRIMCSEYEEREKQFLFCATNTANSCCIHNDSMITINELTHTFTANRPRYSGKDVINGNLQIKNPKKFLIEFYQPQVNVDVESLEPRKFFMTCVHNQWWAAAILALIFIIMGAYLSLCFVSLSKLLSSCFV